MLNLILDTYLDSIEKETDFYSPFMALLIEMEFHDVHFLHGSYEFGKDFIAKKEVDGKLLQYIFQLKAKNIDSGIWRSEIAPQLLNALTTSLSHPNFDSMLSRQVVFVNTRDFIGGAKLDSQNWNDDFVSKINPNKVLFWCKSQLCQYLHEHGLMGIHHSTAQGFYDYGRFFRIYSECLQGKHSDQRLEIYSLCWLDMSLSIKKRILRATLESEVFARQLMRQGFIYEAIICHLATIRTILNASYGRPTNTELEFLKHLYELALKRLFSLCSHYISEIKTQWESAGKNLVAAGFNGTFSYLVHTCRILEVAGLAYLLAENSAQQRELMDFIIEFYSSEPGVGKIPSDRFAVSIVLPVLMAVHQNEVDFAKSLVKKSSEWLLGTSIADFDANEYEEVSTLLGGSLPEFKNLRVGGGGLLKMVLTDLSAFVNDAEFYKEIFSILVGVFYSTYWQIKDSDGITIVEGEDILQCPDLGFRINDSLNNFSDYDYSPHIYNDPKRLSVVEKFGSFSPVMLMILLRDRYFPAMWLQILENATIP